MGNKISIVLFLLLLVVLIVATGYLLSVEMGKRKSMTITPASTPFKTEQRVIFPSGAESVSVNRIMIPN